jgi:23S rRNA U2552 (ribose-2'-O)-methylase RlmE/FtsJ
MNTFEKLFQDHRGRLCSKWHHYFEVYDRHFSRFINKEFTILEIGVAHGGSLQLWKKYFGSKVRIVGIDLIPTTQFSEPQIEVFIGDQTNKDFLLNVIEKIGTPSIIIDDGSHVQSHILASFEVLYPILSEDGVYLIEDCHTAYWSNFQGGINSYLNVVEIFSKAAHDVNTKWYEESKVPKINQLNSLHFYDSVIVFEKKPQEFQRFMINADHSGLKIKDKF